jgi:molybdate transport system regulatory protein
MKYHAQKSATSALDESSKDLQHRDMTRLSIRIDFEGAEAFGPGKARLLELIEEQGSIRGAAAAMNMSYRHAWLLLQAVEDTFGAPVISTATGGAKGGGAKLTELGKTILARFRSIETHAADATAGELMELTKAAAGSAHEDRKRRERSPR